MNKIYTARSGIYLHNMKSKQGGSLTESNDTIKRLSTQINNPSTSLVGLGTQTDVLSKSAIKPSGTSITFGGSGITSQLSKLNFNTDKKYGKNVKLRL